MLVYAVILPIALLSLAFFPKKFGLYLAAIILSIYVLIAVNYGILDGFTIQTPLGFANLIGISLFGAATFLKGNKRAFYAILGVVSIFYLFASLPFENFTSMLIINFSAIIASIVLENIYTAKPALR